MERRKFWELEATGSTPVSLTLLGSRTTVVREAVNFVMGVRFPPSQLIYSSGGTVGSAAKLLTSCGESLRRFDSYRWSFSLADMVVVVTHRSCKARISVRFRVSALFF